MEYMELFFFFPVYVTQSKVDKFLGNGCELKVNEAVTFHSHLERPTPSIWTPLGALSIMSLNVGVFKGTVDSRIVLICLKLQSLVKVTKVKFIQ